MKKHHYNGVKCSVAKNGKNHSKNRGVDDPPSGPKIPDKKP
tara:strand:+ start:399 stop:521 length:123 start_codon:yes stop_codon:yes gene_type:complete